MRAHEHVDLVYELPLPGNCAKCRPGNLLVRHGTWEHLWLAPNSRLVHYCCKTVCTELCQCLSRCFCTVRIRTEHILAAVRRRGRTNCPPPSRQRTGLGRTRSNETPAVCLFPRMHLCCHTRLTHAFQAVLCTHLHQAIVQWQSCQATSFVASHRYRAAYWH